MPTKAELIKQLEEKDKLIEQMQKWLLNLESEIAHLQNQSEESFKTTATYQQQKQEIEYLKTVIQSKDLTINRLQKKLTPPAPEKSKRGRPRSITPQQEEHIITLHKQGHSMRAIATATGVSPATVHKIVHNNSSY